MNATQYYIIDSFIKKQVQEQGHERIPEDDTDSERDGEMDDEEVHSDEEDPEVLAKANKANKDSVTTKTSSESGTKKPRRLQTGSKDYDPQYDGENSPTVVGSASTTERDRLVRKESGDEDTTSNK